ILTERHGENGFGYDPVFYVPEYEKSMAELSAETKNKISHRSRALTEMMKGLTK
ncbi:MAG: non-canonical purine NTP pyrophosphatase, partial [Clostridia bacterium]|nr:non-canonical purine NTP pyrophosphatase [Clostridia bacterium]